MRPRHHIVVIYGVYNLAKECLYVGATRNPWARRYGHLGFTTGKKWNCPAYFKVLRLCKSFCAKEHESKIIQAYWRRGQAQFNKNSGNGFRRIGTARKSLISPARRFSPLQAVEKEQIERALTDCKWNKQESAKRLGIGRQTLYNKIKAYNLKP